MKHTVSLHCTACTARKAPPALPRPRPAARGRLGGGNGMLGATVCGLAPTPSRPPHFTKHGNLCDLESQRTQNSARVQQTLTRIGLQPYVRMSFALGDDSSQHDQYGTAANARNAAVLIPPHALYVPSWNGIRPNKCIISTAKKTLTKKHASRVRFICVRACFRTHIRPASPLLTVHRLASSTFTALSAREHSWLSCVRRLCGSAPTGPVFHSLLSARHRISVSTSRS